MKNLTDTEADTAQTIEKIGTDATPAAHTELPKPPMLWLLIPLGLVVLLAVLSRS